MDRVGALFHGGDDRGAADLLSGTASADLADGAAGVMYACVHARTRALSASLPGIPFRRSSESRRVRRRVRKRECVHAELWGRGRSPLPLRRLVQACTPVNLSVWGRAYPLVGVPVRSPACTQAYVFVIPPAAVSSCTPAYRPFRVHRRSAHAWSCVRVGMYECVQLLLGLGAFWTKFRRSPNSPPFGRGDGRWCTQQGMYVWDACRQRGV